MLGAKGNELSRPNHVLKIIDQKQSKKSNAESK